MKIKDLIKELKKVDGDNTVYLVDGNAIFDFSGVSFDDNNDIEL